MPTGRYVILKVIREGAARGDVGAVAPAPISSTLALTSLTVMCARARLWDQHCPDVVARRLDTKISTRVQQRWMRFSMSVEQLSERWTSQRQLIVCNLAAKLVDNTNYFAVLCCNNLSVDVIDD